MTERPWKLVFLDTETTGLSLDDDIWEIGAIMRTLDAEGNVQQQELHMFVEHDVEKCSQLPKSFRDDHEARFPATHNGGWHPTIVSRKDDAYRILKFTEGAHIVGAVPNFDTERIARLISNQLPKHMRPEWHYHLIDVENLAVGWLGAKGQSVPLPWKSDDLSRLLGVAPPGVGQRHTAMGDAYWAMQLFDAIVPGGKL